MSLLELRARLHYPSGFRFDVAFGADAGVTALSGPSGSGKTTTLSIIAGLRKPDHGFLRLGETVLFDSDRGINLPPEARRIGYVFQQHLLFPHLSVRDNLLYGWERRPKDVRGVEPERVYRVLDLDSLLQRTPATLSGGQRQRIALARALLCSPELLLLDEPLASLDQDLKRQVSAYIEEVLEQWQIPTLYVTHEPVTMRGAPAPIVQLRDGRVVSDPAMLAVDHRARNEPG